MCLIVDSVTKSNGGIVVEYEFVLSTDGFNMSTGTTEAKHDLKCKIIDQVATTEIIKE